ncbi:autotransporter outer membrane beta-barrel domain-containing protein [Pseudomonas sp. AR5]|jgi:uncharacterized protein YhjY with autotransporter beta-barrel domain|nr:autotransporter outer membrane beta-barrel domain-containing protein [Pseudomonas sp. AR5]
MDIIYGAGNWTLFNSYAGVDTTALLQPDTGFIYLQGSAGTDFSLQNYLNANSADLLDWVDRGGVMLLESAGWGTSIAFGGATLQLGPELSRARLTQLAIDSFTTTPVASTERTGSYVSHDIIVPNSGVTLLVLVEGDDPSDPSTKHAVVAGYRYGSGYILYSGLTLYQFHAQADGSSLGADAPSWLTNMIGYFESLASGGGAVSLSALNTLAALNITGDAIRSTANIQLISLNSNLASDCTSFSSNGGCLTLSGRYVRDNDGASEAGYAKVTSAYRFTESFRAGAFLDKGVDNSNLRELNLSTSNPAVGVFAAWSQHADGYGLQARVAASYSQNDVKFSRSPALATEAGTGSTEFESFGYAGEVSYAFPISSEWAAKPYAGLRYTQLKFDGYQEDASAEVTAPLAFDTLRLESTTATAGVRLVGQVAQRLRIMSNLGVEHDLSQNYDDLRGTSSITGLERFSVDAADGSRRSRAVAGIGAAYALPHAQEISVNADWYQQSFSRDNGSSITASYSVGF